MASLTLQMAKQLIEQAERKAEEIRVPMVIAIVDAGGHLVACHKMDDALLVSLDIAQNKAWSSVALKLPTADLADVASPGGSLYGIITTNQGKIVIFGGGIPLKMEGQIIGAIGVSGGSVEEDICVAQAAAEYFEQFS